MNMKDYSKRYTVLIIVCTLLVLIAYVAVSSVSVIKTIKGLPEKLNADSMQVVEEEWDIPEATDEAVFVEEEFVAEAPVEEPVYEDPVIINEDIEGYDYSVDSSDSFDTGFVVTDELIEASQEPTVILKDLEFALDVNWNTLCSNETYEAIYANIQKDETFDADKQTRCLNKIAQSMKTTQAFMATAEGTTAKIEYGFYTAATELMIELRVLDTEGNVCYTEYFGLGVTSNEGDI